MKLLVPIFLNTVLVVGLYLIFQRTGAKKLPNLAKQLIAGLLFGGVSAFASSYGVELLGTVVNVRDAAPLSAGLIFGAPAGILAGFIGGLYRWFSVAWGGGTYTRLACTLATILAGFLAAGVRKYMFDNKKTTWGYGICITVVCEVLHMMLIFLTNMDDSADAFRFVQQASIPMILGNSLAVGAALLLVTLLSHEKLTRQGSEHIAQTFQRWLLFCIVGAFVFSWLFTYSLQSGMSTIETHSVISLTLNDVRQDIADASDKKLLEIAHQVAREYQEDPDTNPNALLLLAQSHGVREINLVDESFTIVASSSIKNLGFDMAGGAQSQEFQVLLQGQSVFVQPYQATAKSDQVMRKYAGVALPQGGFIQVGYDSHQFQSDIGARVLDATRNRHVGTAGHIMICDESLRMITEGRYNGRPLTQLGITLDPETMPPTSLYEATVEGTDCFYTYTTTEGFYIVGIMSQEEAMFMRDASLYTSVFMQVLIFAALFVFIYFLIKRVIINNLRRINSTLSQITNGNLELTVDVRSNAEFASLSDDINSTVSTLKRYIAEAAARIDKELEYAKQIQLGALPTNFPDNNDYAICAQMIAAKEVGGDFYDFYTLDDNTVAFLAADVSGKGIPAAMFMMTAKTILKDLAESGLPVDEVFTRANEKLCENNESGMFVTAWMGMLDLRTGLLTYANAGHNPPLLRHSGGDYAYLRTRAGFVLAGMEGLRYKAGQMQLEPGDRIFLYTDGVTEATDTAQALYGEDRLLQFMNRNRITLAPQLLPQLKADIDAFVGDAPQFDDITMLMLDYRGGQKLQERNFPARDETLRDVLSFVEQTLEAVDCPMKTSVAICVAIEEVFVNIAHYAYGQGQGDMHLAIGFRETDRTLTFRLRDRGVPFDPLQRQDPDITLAAQDRQIGGLGIFIAKKTMDEISYRYADGENILTMTKKI